MSNESRFTDVYEKSRWFWRGTMSGEGSAWSECEHLAQWLESEVDQGMRSVLDMGCGDLEWISRCASVTGGKVEYFGVDVVPTLIAHHRRIFPWFKGEVRDLEEMPKIEADIVILKDVLFHLCNGAAGQILMNVNAGTWRRLLVSTHLGANNVDRRGLTQGKMAALDVEATGLIDGTPVRYLSRSHGAYAIYER
jgi:hypothetical protein